MTDHQALSPQRITIISTAVAEGRADPEDARQLMQIFCDYVGDGRQVPSRLMEHFKECFQAILDGGRRVYPEPGQETAAEPIIEKCSVKTALGLEKKRGRASVNIEKRIRLAAEVLRRRLNGLSYEKAIAEVSGVPGIAVAERVVASAWSEHFEYAVYTLQIERSFGPWTEAEKAVLQKLFSERQTRFAAKKGAL